MHVETLIKPALQKGRIVISDRFTDSTRAYQSYGHGLDINFIEQLNTLSLQDFAPDLTFILDIPAEAGLARAGKRQETTQSEEDRFEQLGTAFHEKLRQGFLTIAEQEPERCHVIDAAQTIETVAAAIATATEGALAHV